MNKEKKGLAYLSKKKEGLACEVGFLCDLLTSTDSIVGGSSIFIQLGLLVIFIFRVAIQNFGVDMGLPMRLCPCLETKKQRGKEKRK